MNLVYERKLTKNLVHERKVYPLQPLLRVEQMHFHLLQKCLTAPFCRMRGKRGKHGVDIGHAAMTHVDVEAYPPLFHVSAGGGVGFDGGWITEKRTTEVKLKRD